MPSAPQLLRAPLPASPSPSARWKNRLAESRAALHRRYLENHSASDLLRRHRLLVDNQLADGWTIVTKDHSLSAQWEHTVLVTPDGFEVLTLSSGAPALPDFAAPRHG